MGNENRKRQPPLLLTIHDGEHEKQSVYRPVESQYHTTCIPVLCNQRILASTHGWLVLVSQRYSNGECCLWNPVSGDIIELPRLDQSFIYNICVLSKPPTEPDCHILFNSACTVEQSFCKIGDVDFVHQSLKEEDYQLMAIASFQGKIYGLMDPGYKFVTIEFVGKTIELRPMLINGEQPWKAPQPKRNWVVWHENYLIESPSGDDFLLVIKLFTHDFIIDSSEIRVFRVDINRMECIELDDIGDQTIFIGNGTGFCCSSGGTIKPNSVYYTTDDGVYVYVYDLDDRSTSSLLPHDVGHKEEVNHYWVDPIIIRH